MSRKNLQKQKTTLYFLTFGHEVVLEGNSENCDVNRRNLQENAEVQNQDERNPLHQHTVLAPEEKPKWRLAEYDQQEILNFEDQID